MDKTLEGWGRVKGEKTVGPERVGVGKRGKDVEGGGRGAGEVS